VASRRLLWVVLIGIALTMAVLVANHDSDTIAGLNTNDFGSLAYHVGLVVLVGSGALVLFRERLAQALEAALFWAVIGFILAFGYTYRTELRGIADRVMAETREWASQFQVPVLQLATGKLSIDSLDPRNLSTIPAAEALAARADSSRRAWQTVFDSLDVQRTLDSSQAALERLRRARVTDLAALNDARRAIDNLKRARDRVTNLDRDVKAGVATLRAGLAGLDSARRRDYAFARSLLKLPSLDAPEIGAALFAPHAITPFERVLYWAQLARRYMPPGLLPRATTAPKRVRRAGEDVRFPKERALPTFLLRSAELSFQLRQGQRYAGRLTGLTSEPALYGRPTALVASGPQLGAGAMLNHVNDPPRDTAGITLGGIRLPALNVPALPLRLDPGDATAQISFQLKGDTMNARWSLRSSNVRWAADSGLASSDIGELIWRAVSGITNLEVEARVSGPLHKPNLAVRSNLDQVIANRIRAVVGEEVAAAERQLRAKVDALVNEKVTPVRARVADVQSQVADRVAQQRARVDEVQKQLEQRLRELTGGIRIPPP